MYCFVSTCASKKIRHPQWYKRFANFWIDGVIEFRSDEIKEYCAENDNVLQLVVT